MRFQNEAAIAQGPVAELDTLDGRRRVVFRADPTGRARLTSGRIRVAADRIDTDEEGVETRAEGRVEATLLPGQEARGTSRSVVFRDDEAVHFVSERMLSSGRGSSVQFQGNVRGWQGERSLQADDVRLDDPTQRLQARGAVTTRSPITEGVAISQPDYVEIRSVAGVGH